MLHLAICCPLDGPECLPLHHMIPLLQPRRENHYRQEEPVKAKLLTLARIHRTQRWWSCHPFQKIAIIACPLLAKSTQWPPASCGIRYQMVRVVIKIFRDTAPKYLCKTIFVTFPVGPYIFVHTLLALVVAIMFFAQADSYSRNVRVLFSHLSNPQV